jgi:hypothetical protein
LLVLALKSQHVPHLALADLPELNVLAVFVIDVCVTLKLYVRRLDFNFAGVTLATEVELNHWHTQELSIATDVSWHWYLEVLVCVSICEGLECLRWITDGSDWNIFNNEISIFKVRLSMLRAEEQFKVNVLSSRNSSLCWTHSVMSQLIF